MMILALTVGVAPALSGCPFRGGTGEPVPTVGGAVLPTSATLSIKTDKGTLVVGDTLALTTAITNAGANLVSYTSSATGVATVDGKGVVTAINVGTTTIQARLGTLTSTLTLRVVTGLQPELLQVDTVDIQPGTQTVTRVGSQLVFSALARDTAKSAIPGLTIFWFSSNPNVATITPGGVLTIVGAGTTDVTASAGDKRSTPSTITVPGGSVNVNVDFGAS